MIVGTTSGPESEGIRRRIGKTRLWLALFVVMLLVVEGVSYLLILVANRVAAEPISRVATIYADQSERIAAMLDTTVLARDQLDAGLGWRYRAGYADSVNHLNSAGMRALHGYQLDAPPGMLRIAVFGDSFVYGNEVADADAWTAQLESMDADLEVLNYGVGGYGTDQAFLRYLTEGMTHAPAIVLIGFVPVNLRRIVNVYRRFISIRERPVMKPRFMLADADGLRLLSQHIPTREDYERYQLRPEDVRELGEHDQWYEPAVYNNPLHDYSALVRLGAAVWIRVKRRWLDPHRLIRDAVFNEQAEAFRIQVRVMLHFADSVRARGASPLVVLFPDRWSVGQAVAGRRLVYEPLKATLEAAGVPVFDLAPRFVEAAGRGEIKSLFMLGGHYSPSGNRVVAEALLEHLSTGL